MLKLTAIVCLMLIATWSQAEFRRNKKEGSPTSDFDSGNTLWAASLSCDSCGSECASACGTRHFRSCCFNYLRKKRGQESLKVFSENLHDMKSDGQKSKIPLLYMDDIPEPWSTNMLTNEFKPYPFDDTLDNHLQLVYDV